MEKPSEHKCSAYRQGSLVCCNGFIQTFSCWGDTACLSCGRHSARLVPHCVKDELPEHWVDEAGRPAFRA
jgi:hypothetical protein